ncbi:MAG: acyl-CoA thioesterase [Pseudomonadota bacterium]|nr:acyl-CoA thioesterase [Pseudomonadota bacterium]
MITQITVRWGDMDAYQHVNNAVYLSWLETARIEFAQAHLPSAITFIVAHISIDYSKPVFYPDTVICESHIEKIGRTSLHMTTSIHSKKQNIQVAQGRTVIVNFNYASNQTLPWDEKTRKILMRFTQTQ